MKEAEREFRHLESTEGVTQVNNPIKTADVKRAIRSRAADNEEIMTPTAQWGNGQAEVNREIFFNQKKLNCLKIASSRANTLRVSYIAEFNFWTVNIFGAKGHVARFPIDFFGDNLTHADESSTIPLSIA